MLTELILREKKKRTSDEKEQTKEQTCFYLNGHLQLNLFCMFVFV